MGLRWIEADAVKYQWWFGNVLIENEFFGGNEDCVELYGRLYYSGWHRLPSNHGYIFLKNGVLNGIHR